MQWKDYITLRVASLLVALCLLKDGSQSIVRLETNELNSFRPIFNIPFISKLIEKAVLQ